MITAMCAVQGVEVNPSKKIRTTIDKRYIELYSAPGGDYIPEEGPSGVADEDAPVVGDGAGVDFQDADFEDNFDRIMRGD
ncbi:hypothetical protein SESBI_14339 [Sesbania bispinosa]|nr:hypothetical protein SESBI_14339 [Sesbania bispinosa]